jgi:hypothetical protein
LALAVMGREVLPVDARTHQPCKDPRTDLRKVDLAFDLEWHDASSVPERVLDWWQKYPKALVGLRVGERRFRVLTGRGADRSVLRDLVAYWSGDPLANRESYYVEVPLGVDGGPMPGQQPRTIGIGSGRAVLMPGLHDDGDDGAWEPSRKSLRRGIVDTIELRLDQRIADNDRPRLCRSEEGDDIDGRGVQTTLVTKDDRTVGEFGSYTFRRDQVRVRYGDRGIVVAFEVPRVALGSPVNHNVAEVTRAGLIDAIQAKTADLFPATTAKAEERGQRWYVTRIDMAVNFTGSVPLVVESLRLARLPGVQGYPTVHGLSTVEWVSSQGLKLHVYDRREKTLQQIKGALGSRKLDAEARQALKAMRERFKALPAGSLGRVELQVSGHKELAKLAAHLAPDGRPTDAVFKVGSGHQNPPIRPVALDHEAMHRYLIKRVRSVTGQRQLVTMAQSQPGNLLAAFAVAEHPELVHVLDLGDRTRRGLLDDAAALSVEVGVPDLLRRFWP